MRTTLCPPVLLVFSFMALFQSSWIPFSSFFNDFVFERSLVFQLFLKVGHHWEKHNRSFALLGQWAFFWTSQALFTCTFPPCGVNCRTGTSMLVLSERSVVHVSFLNMFSRLCLILLEAACMPGASLICPLHQRKYSAGPEQSEESGWGSDPQPQQHGTSESSKLKHLVDSHRSVFQEFFLSKTVLNSKVLLSVTARSKMLQRRQMPTTSSSRWVKAIMIFQHVSSCHQYGQSSRIKHA